MTANIQAELALREKVVNPVISTKHTWSLWMCAPAKVLENLTTGKVGVARPYIFVGQKKMGRAFKHLTISKARISIELERL